MTGARGNVLVTGGAGFIGSHACKALARAGHRPVVFDNLVTGDLEAVRWGPFYHGDVRDTAKLIEVLAEAEVDAVMHFAAHAYVGESMLDPQKYYRNNVGGLVSLLDATAATGVRKLIFSSSCATYGSPDVDLIDETTPQRPINPYGRTKLIGEQVIADYAQAAPLAYGLLRYFNACGADPDGELVENHDPETHLIPRALMAGLGIIEELEVFGNDYPTPDKTCLRDFIHVMDLANGHVRALEKLDIGMSFAANLGTGRGHSILEVIRACETELGAPVPLSIQPRRPGDPPRLVARASLARELLGFEPEFSDLPTIVEHAARALMRLHAIPETRSE